MSTTINLDTLKINYLTQAQYDTALSNDQINENEIYMTPFSYTGFLNFFYPVGSYYETSDTTFNPNTSWGGTWVLETEGQVHISGSASGTYQVSGATTNTSDGGAATVTLTEADIPAHTHGNKSITGSFWARKHGSNASDNVAAYSGICSTGTYGGPNYTGATSNTTVSGYKPGVVVINASHEHTSFGSNGAHNNMQPYIIVNRWHRTA